jgi:hypothetical protein
MLLQPMIQLRQANNKRFFKQIKLFCLDSGKPPRHLQARVDPDDQAPDQGRLRLLQVHQQELPWRNGRLHHALRSVDAGKSY